ncbi:MAG: phytoene/squalene synthase family protein [Thermoguttaceae bacterium]
MQTANLQTSFALCRARTLAARSNLTVAFRLLPTEKRRAMEVLYACMRYTDDLADSPNTSIANNSQQLDVWRNAVLAYLVLRESNMIIMSRFPALADGVAILPAVRWMVDTFNIPPTTILQVIEGAKSDTHPQRFRTFDDVAAYCHLVATAVGHASLAIWGTREPLTSPQIVEAANACGLAFQWTNILRDQVEDAQCGRLYLPIDEIEQCGLTEAELLAWLEDPLRDAGEVHAKWLQLMSHQFERCERFFSDAALLAPLIDADSRSLFRAMFGAYQTLFRIMQRSPERILAQRVRLSAWDKLCLAVRGVLKL